MASGGQIDFEAVAAGEPSPFVSADMDMSRVNYSAIVDDKGMMTTSSGNDGSQLKSMSKEERVS